MEEIHNQEAALHTSQSPLHDAPLPTSPIEFAIGQLVALRSDPKRVGAIINVLPGRPENRFIVFLDNTPSTYYASQLQRHDLSTPSIALTPLPVFHAYMTALQLNHPSLATLYSLNAARVNFVPYQFRPVLKFIHADRPRLLIADEVGVGKTIEAGLILRELQARKDVHSVLIICPKPLVTERKWQIEMKRFDEQFIHLDGPTLRHCIKETDLDGIWPEQYAKAILPFSLFNQELLSGTFRKNNKRGMIGLLELSPPPHFDLVIVDEAHHLCNTSTATHQGVRYFCEQAEAVIFLSATPIQMGTNDLFVLLQLLRPDLILDKDSFDHMAEPNPLINHAVEVARANVVNWQNQALAALMAAAETPWGQVLLHDNPAFQRLHTELRTGQLNDQQRVACVHELEQLHTFSRLINRTRRRDIGTFTTRKPETVNVSFTPQQQYLHDTLLNTQQNILHRTHGDINVKFLMTTIRRQAASCLYGLAPLLKDILTRHIDLITLTEADEEGDLIANTSPASLEAVEEQIQAVLALANHLDPHDPKWNALLKIVRDKQKLDKNKLLLFSSFRHTLFYLLERLQQAGVRVALIHGDTPDEDRRMLRDRFSRPKEDVEALDMLLSSEVGCEGLDYQFCDCLVNYDLPWNPMRIEQRIGRIDRYGQKSETVAIYNLITPGTVDAEIYERCLVRIGIFHQAVGGSEEILGRITHELREVAENLALTREEIQTRLQQIADNEIRLIQEQAALEEQQKDLFGISLPAQQLKREIQNAASFWLSPWALQNVIQYYLEQNCGIEQTSLLGEKLQKRLRLNQEARNVVLQHLQQLPRQHSPVFREWEKWLKGSSPYLSITFDAVYADENRDIVFINAIHPLAQQAAQIFENNEVLYTAFYVVYSPIVPGIYHFGIWLWQKSGIREEVTLQPVCNDQAITEHFLEMLQHALPVQTSEIQLPDQAVFDRLDVYHHSLWNSAQVAHKTYNAQLAQYRKESLQTSHQAHISQLRTQLMQTTEENIRRMRIAQISNVEADFNRRMNELDRATQRADISAQPVAFGVIVVKEAERHE
jgi:superfamily II DNA or RNA helicase